MPKLISKPLNKLSIDRAMKSGKEQTLFDSSVRGLGVRVTKNGSASWFVQTRDKKHRQTKLRLAGYPSLGLADARDAARLKLSEINRTDTRAKKKQLRVPTLSELFEEWMKTDQASNKSRGNVRNALEKHVLPTLGDCEVRDLTRGEFTAIFAQLAEAGKKAQSNRVMSFCKRMFAWASENELMPNHLLADVKTRQREVSRDRVLSNEELSNIWNAAAKLEYPWSSFFRLLILTGLRLNEVGQALWPEVDLDKKLFSVSKERSKNNEAHDVHLGPTALDILKLLPVIDKSPLLFPSAKGTPISTFSTGKGLLDKESGVQRWRIHDLRRTFATRLGDLGVAPHVIDKMLNHKSGSISGVAAVYQRATFWEERKAAYELWDQHLTRLGQTRLQINIAA